MQKLRRGKFPYIFEPLSAETIGPMWKVWGCKNGTNILYLQTKFGGDPPPLTLTYLTPGSGLTHTYTILAKQRVVL